MSDITPGQAIDQASQELAPNDDEFRKIMHAIAMAESGGRPDAVGDNGQSIGLYQNRMVYGRGGNYSKDQLLEPLFNARLAAKELYRVYQQGVNSGLKGQQLVAYVSRYGQRPAAGLEWNAAKHYGEYVNGSKGAVSDLTNINFFPDIPENKPATIYNDYIKKWMAPTQQVQAAEPRLMVTPTNPNTASYTVRPGDTLWGIAKEYLGNGNLYPQLQGYTGNPTQMQVGTVIKVPIRTENKPQMSSSINSNAANYVPTAYSSAGAPYSPASYKPAVSVTPVSTPAVKNSTTQTSGPMSTSSGVYPIASTADGRVKYSDGSIR